MRLFIVVNPLGLYVRSKPDSKTGQIIRKMTMGEAFKATDAFVVNGNETWARLTSGESVQQQYSMIEYTGRPAFAREQTPTAASAASGGDPWRNAVDAWLRLKGYDGPLP